MRFCLHCVAAFSTLTVVVAGAQETTQHVAHSMGRVTQAYYADGALLRSWTGSYDIYWSKRGYQILLLAPETEDTTLKYFISSDFNEVFQSDIGELRGSPPAQVAYGAFGKGKMPAQMEGWGVPEVLALSFILTSDVSSRQLTSLPKELELRYIQERQKREGFRYRTEIAVGREGELLRVRFIWTGDAMGGTYESRPEADPPTVADLRILGEQNGFPTEVHFVSTHVWKAPDANLPRITPISSYHFTQTETGTVLHDKSDRAAYDDYVRVSVNDYRFGARYGYSLPPGDPPPFRGAPQFSDIESAAGQREDRARVHRFKGAAVFTVLCALPLAFIWVNRVVLTKGKRDRDK